VGGGADTVGPTLNPIALRVRLRQQQPAAQRRGRPVGEVLPQLGHITSRQGAGDVDQRQLARVAYDTGRYHTVAQG